MIVFGFLLRFRNVFGLLASKRAPKPAFNEAINIAGEEAGS